MAEPTTRDDVWAVALAVTLRENRAATPEDVADRAGASERMVRDCLNVMASKGYLKRDVATTGAVRFLPPEWLGPAQ